MDNFTQYCLMYTFTSRDFNDGTLGLAWLASNTGAGGLCSIFDGTKTLNTGMITIKNYNTRVSDLMAKLAFVHEVGHSFGSPHDPTSCTPGNSNGGNYLMFSHANTGQQSNNAKFSSCSQVSIGTVLQNLVNTGNICFTGIKGVLK